MTDLSAFRPVPLWQRMVAAGLASLLIPFGAAALMVGILSILTGGTDPEALRGAELSPPIAALILSVQFLSFASSMAWLGYVVLIPITLRRTPERYLASGQDNSILGALIGLAGGGVIGVLLIMNGNAAPALWTTLGGGGVGLIYGGVYWVILRAAFLRQQS